MSNDGASDPVAASGRFRAFGWATIGLLFLGLGAWEARTLTWDEVTATVGECGVSRPYNKQPGSRYCAVVWQGGGRQHTANVPADQNMVPGAQTTVRVNGDEASEGPGLLGSGSCCCGAVVLLVAGSVLWRDRHP